MRTNVRHITSGLVVVAAITVLAAGASAPVFAARSVDPSTLIPPPPSKFNPICKAIGYRTICDVTFNDPAVVAEPTGIQCGSGPDAFEILDSFNRSVDGKRFYDQDRMLTERHFHDLFVGALTNALTGGTLPYRQHDTIMHDLAVAGDITTGTEAITIALRVTTPNGGTVLIDAGRTVLAESDGTILFQAGQHHFDEFYVLGQTSALQSLCDALQ